MVHLDKATLQNQSILKTTFQNPTSCSAGAHACENLTLFIPHVTRIEHRISPCAAGSRAAAPGKPGLPARAVFGVLGWKPDFGLLGRNAAKRAQKFPIAPTTLTVLYSNGVC
jgi:hypothetical protein